jgi:hypothetical protein
MRKKVFCRISFLLICIFIFLSTFVTSAVAQKADLPPDPHAMKGTADLYRNLKKLAVRGFLFGQQDARREKLYF